MKILIILVLLTVLLAIMFSKGLHRFTLLMIGIFFLNDTIGIKPFNSYTMLLMAFFISLIIHKELKRNWKDFPFKGVLIIILIIHILVVQFDERSFPILTYISRVFNNFIPRFLALFVGYAAITSIQEWRKCAHPMSMIFLIMGIYGFITFFLQKNPYDDILQMAFYNEIGIWSEVQNRGYRVFSTLNNPIVYGYVMFIAATYLYLQKKNLSRTSYIVIILLTILNTFLANSRTGLVAGALMIAVYALIEYRFSYRFIGYATSVIILFFILYQFIPFVHNSVGTIMDIFADGGGNTGGSDIELKEAQLETSLLFFYMHPYLGNGFNYFQEVIRQRFNTMDIGLYGLEGYGYKLLVEEGSFMIVAVVWLFSGMIVFFFRRLNVKQISSMAIAWTVSFLFFIMGTGTYGGIFTIGMLFIGMLLKYAQFLSPDSKKVNWKTNLKPLISNQTFR